MPRVVASLRPPCLRRVLACSWGGLLLLAGVAFGADPRGFTAGFRTDQWNAEQGLPQNTVQCLQQTPDGYLWAGTRFGLVRYDGFKRFSVFQRANTPALRSENCLALATDAAGQLWVGTDDGLLCRSGQTWQRFTTTNGLGHNCIRALAPRRAGGLWVGTEQGVSWWASNRFVTLLPQSRDLHPAPDRRVLVNDVPGLAEDSTGTLWIVNHGGLQRLRPGETNFTVVAPDAWASRVAVDAADRVWWTETSHLRRLADGVDETFSLPDATPGQHLELLGLDRQGTPWVKGPQGRLFVFRAGAFQSVPTPDSLAIHNPLRFLQDREGNDWLGTEFGGLFRLQPRRLHSLAQRDGLAGNRVTSACLAPDGAVWLATDGGLSRFGDGTFRNFAASATEPFLQVPSVLWMDRQTNLWGATSKGLQGLSRFDFQQGFFVREMLRLPGDTSGIPFSVESFYEAPDGLLWAGTSRGVMWRSAAGWEALPGSPPNVRAFLRDRSGALWLGTVGHGLWRWQAGQFTVFTKTNGLPSDQVWVLHEDAAGTLWCAGDAGLTRLRAGQFARLTTEQGLFDNLINQLLEDDRGQFWLSCNRGIFRVARRELDAVADGLAQHVTCVTYTEADGLEISETNGEHQPAGCRDRAGQLWFPSMYGVIRIDPHAELDNTHPPSVVIEQVRTGAGIVFGDGCATPALAAGSGARPPELRLPPGSGHVLEIRYAATTFVAPEGVRFSYQLDGYDPRWHSDDENLRVAAYTNLRPGRYRFRVQAWNSHGYPGDEIAELRLVIAPYFRETAAFKVLCALALLGAAVGVQAWRLRLQRRILHLEHQHALDRERARIAHDIHDDLGSRLSQIAILGELADRALTSPDAARRQLNKMRTATGEVFQALDEIVWAANPKQDSVAGLASYLREYAAEFLAAADVACRLDLPNPVPAQPLTADVRHHLFLAVREALTNIVKHAHATEVRLRLGWTAGTLTVVIEDNGRGFVVPASDTPAPGNGLVNLRERIAGLGGEIQLHSNPGMGTRIEFRVTL